MKFNFLLPTIFTKILFDVKHRVGLKNNSRPS